MEYKTLLTDIENLSQMITEGEGDGKILRSIKSKIKNFVNNASETSLKEALPNIISHIKNFFSAKNTKYLLVFLVKILLSVGLSVASIKDAYTNNQVDNMVKWERFEQKEIKDDVIKFTHNFNIGEYKIDDSVAHNIIQEIESKISKEDTLIIKGTVLVGISVEDNPYSNYANDDTAPEKEKGGKLIQKRKKEARAIIKAVENELLDKGYNVKFNLSYKSNRGIGRVLQINNVEIFGKSTHEINLNNKDLYIDQDGIDNATGEATTPSGGDPTPDITGLSKNYQYVEFLKLGGIETDRVQGDKRDNEYSSWIVDTRKHPKRMLRRLQVEYPEYNITFNKDSKAKNSVAGARKGLSNIHQQYTEVKENYMFTFEQFMNESNDENQLQRVWQKILGRKFPELTQEQAELFDKNIDKVLDYLEQMYGSSAIEFKYELP